ncbi:MAG: GtrA family protein [Candidatus Saccharibacteria bacterium]|nr:MAG: GtrA family protein [Candidatus Saccharibacteria bacterium]
MKNNSQKMRFVLVGGLNTAIDFGLLFLLRSFGLPVITSNIISTTAAFCFSFFANKKYTFKTTDTNIVREIVFFVAITLFGLWVLQTVVIYVVTAAFSGLRIPDNLTLLIAKLVATVVSLVWNYTMYSRVVFTKQPNQRS